MKVIQVVTYISPDGAFGGPVRVALGQAEALADRGHDVTVYAAAPPELAGVVEQDGYTLRTFPARRVAPFGGFAAMTSPALMRALKEDAASYDVGHVHLARDLVTLPAARTLRRAGVPYLVQPHGMIDESRNLLTKPLDLFVTRPRLRDAFAVLVLTDTETEDIAQIEPRANSVRIGNGLRIGNPPPYGERPNIVLYLARLHTRKRPVAFVQMAGQLGDLLPDTRFVLAGPDEGEGGAVSSAIEATGMGDRIEWIGSVDPARTDELFAAAKAYVLPAFGEVFPMTILESFRAGTPVVTTGTLGIADACREYGAALITDGSPGDLAAAVSRIMQSEAEAEGLRAGGLAYLRSELNIEDVVAKLEQMYSEGRSENFNTMSIV